MGILQLWNHFSCCPIPIIPSLRPNSPHLQQEIRLKGIISWGNILLPKNIIILIRVMHGLKSEYEFKLYSGCFSRSNHWGSVTDEIIDQGRHETHYTNLKMSDLLGVCHSPTISNAQHRQRSIISPIYPLTFCQVFPCPIHPCQHLLGNFKLPFLFVSQFWRVSDLKGYSCFSLSAQILSDLLSFSFEMIRICNFLILFYIIIWSLNQPQ